MVGEANAARTRPLHMGLYGPTFHATPIDLGIIFQCKIYISCVMSCENELLYYIVLILSALS